MRQASQQHVNDAMLAMKLRMRIAEMRKHHEEHFPIKSFDYYPSSFDNHSDWLVGDGRTFQLSSDVAGSALGGGSRCVAGGCLLAAQPPRPRYKNKQMTRA